MTSKRQYNRKQLTDLSMVVFGYYGRNISILITLPDAPQIQALGDSLSTQLSWKYGASAKSGGLLWQRLLERSPGISWRKARYDRRFGIWVRYSKIYPTKEKHGKIKQNNQKGRYLIAVDFLMEHILVLVISVR